MKKALTSKYSTLRACLRSENYHQWRKATAAHRLLAPGCCGEDAFREGQGIISYPRQPYYSSFPESTLMGPLMRVAPADAQRFHQ